MVLTSNGGRSRGVTGLPSGNLNFTRYLFKVRAGVSFLSGSVLLIRRTPDCQVAGDRSSETPLLDGSKYSLRAGYCRRISCSLAGGADRWKVMESEFLLSPSLSAGYWLEELLRPEIGIRTLPLLSWDRTWCQGSSAAHASLWATVRE